MRFIAPWAWTVVYSRIATMPTRFSLRAKYVQPSSTCCRTGRNTERVEDSILVPLRNGLTVGPTRRGAPLTNRSLPRPAPGSSGRVGEGVGSSARMRGRRCLWERAARSVDGADSSAGISGEASYYGADSRRATWRQTIGGAGRKGAQELSFFGRVALSGRAKALGVVVQGRKITSTVAGRLESAEA
jgi:hypothetical protein